MTSQADHRVVVDLDGVRGTFDARAEQNADTGRVIVDFDGDRQVWVSRDLLRPQPDGSLYLPLRLTELETLAGGDGEQIVIPVIEEQAVFGKRVVESGRVRISKTVHEREEIIDQPLLRDEVDVQRVTVNQFADAPVGVRQEGDTTIIPILEEVLVIQRRILVKEELRVTKRRAEYRAPQNILLRNENITVERLEPGAAVRAREKPST